MDFNMETAQISVKIECKQNNNKKRQICDDAGAENENVCKQPRLENTTPPPLNKTEHVQQQKSATKSMRKTSNQPNMPAHQSPKKRLDLTAAQLSSNTQANKLAKNKFIYGNYNQYYSYRNKDYHDIRLDVFDGQRELFRDKHLLDIGCNCGFITMEMAKRFTIKSIVGLDIDRSLIKQANKNLVKQKKSLDSDNDVRQRRAYPFNVHFLHGNYVLRDDVLLEIERAQFDVILCLSITKWIHLNFGDSGLKQAFRRMFLQLRSGGKLILEPQSFDTYNRRKKLTDITFANYKAMQFLPKQFTEYLLSSEVGFKSVELMGVPEHCAAGFKRPIQIFHKE